MCVCVLCAYCYVRHSKHGVRAQYFTDLLESNYELRAPYVSSAFRRFSVRINIYFVNCTRHHIRLRLSWAFNHFIRNMVFIFCDGIRRRKYVVMLSNEMHSTLLLLLAYVANCGSSFSNVLWRSSSFLVSKRKCHNWFRRSAIYLLKVSYRKEIFD